MNNPKSIASNLANSFDKEFQSNNNKGITNLFEDWIFYYRYYGVKWNKLFLNELKKVMNEELFFNILDNFDLKIKLNNNQIKNIETIIKTKHQKIIYFNFESNIDSVSYIRLYRSYILNKHINASVYYYLKIFNKGYDTVDKLFKNISKHSISGDLFFKDNDNESYYFSIPKNRSSAFMFLNKNSIYSIDVSISQNYDSKILIPHFLIIQSSYSKDINKFKNNIVENNKLEYIEIIKPLSNDDKNNIKNIPKDKCNYILCHESDIEYSFLSNDDFKNIKFISLMKSHYFNFRINPNIYKVIFSNLKYSTQSENFNYVDIQYTMSFLINKFIKNDLSDYEKIFTPSDFNIIKNSLTNIFSNILFNLDEVSSYNNFHKSCSFFGVEREADIDLLYRNLSLKDDYNSINKFNIKEFNQIRIKLLKNIIEEVSAISKAENKNKKELKNDLTNYLDISEKEVRKILKLI